MLGRDLLPPTSKELAERAEAAEAPAGGSSAASACDGHRHPGSTLRQMGLELAASRAETRKLRDKADRNDDAEVQVAGLLSEVQQLERELRASLGELTKIREESRQRTAQLMDAQVRRRSAERKLRRRKERRARFATQEEQFRFELYLEWAERVSASEKATLQLKEFSVGGKFLESFYKHSEEHQQKTLKALVDLLVGRAGKVNGRQVHALRTGCGGDDPQAFRQDGAKCWRMAVETNVPAARRIHFWCIPGGGIELHELVPHDVTTV